jgi:beta-phosphoglucomutase
MSVSLAAVLFDFDGVIGDTVEDNYLAWRAAFAPYGIVPDRTECFLLEGKKTAELAATVLERHGLEPALGPTVGAAKDAHYAAHNRFAFYPGVLELIPALQRAGLKVAVVSGGMRRRLFNPLTVDFLSSFDTVVTADECSRGKPEPEPFLKAAEKLGVLPERCLVVENAPLGVTAAKRAGMRCIAVTSSLSAEHLREADIIVPHVGDIVAHLPAQSEKSP